MKTVPIMMFIAEVILLALQLLARACNNQLLGILSFSAMLLCIGISVGYLAFDIYRGGDN